MASRQDEGSQQKNAQRKMAGILRTWHWRKTQILCTRRHHALQAEGKYTSFGATFKQLKKHPFSIDIIPA